MAYQLKIYNKNNKLILTTNKVYEYDLKKFVEFLGSIQDKIHVKIENYYDEQDDKNNDVKEDEEIETNYESDESEAPQLFYDMTIEKYGKGYTLECAEDHQDYGIKYYHHAWWFPNLKAWFFKKEYLDYFLENGAVFK